MLHTIFFDLDNTLYPRDSGIWETIGKRINLFIIEILGLDEADVPQIRQYCRENFGTTLIGLKSMYPVDDLEYLAFVHDIDLSCFLSDNGQLENTLEKITQRKIIFTNADVFHANRVLDFLGVRSYFEQVIDVLALKPYAKPDARAFKQALSLSGLHSAEGCVFVDDMVENVEQGLEQGFMSILVGEEHDIIPSIPNIYSLPSFLASH